VSFTDLQQEILEDFAEHQAAHIKARGLEAIRITRREPGARARRREVELPASLAALHRRQRDERAAAARLARVLRFMAAGNEQTGGSWKQRTAAIEARTRALCWDRAREQGCAS
jgi:hypothetical protein